jgi:YD repeat-containing protein
MQAFCSAWLLQGSPAQAEETITYAYDALGRLIALNSSGSVNNGRAVTIGYDVAGNRMNFTATGNGSGSGGDPDPPPQTATPRFRLVFNGRFFAQLVRQ